jgi:SH3-like domain-containing protein
VRRRNGFRGFGRSWRLLSVLGAVFLTPPAAVAADNPASEPLPRFATLRADEVNLRVGPGKRYPIEWVYRRKGLPVEVFAAFETWRKVRDSDGTEGWVDQHMIAAARAVVVQGDVREIHAAPDARSAVVARAAPGVIAKLVECSGPWCRIDAQDARGWVKRSEVWGVYPDEDVH